MSGSPLLCLTSRYIGVRETWGERSLDELPPESSSSEEETGVRAFNFGRGVEGKAKVA